VLYRGLEMSQLARLLVLTAKYYQYTGDGSMLMRHEVKLAGIATLLLGRRNEALARWPAEDPRHGMPTGDDEADMFVSALLPKSKTELPFISIAGQCWRGFRDLGAALLDIAQHNSSVSASLVSLGQNLTAHVPAMRTDFERSMKRSVVPGPFPRCFPYVAGAATCDELNSTQASVDRASESWRTYSEVLMSGILDAATTTELLVYHQTVPRTGGSRLKLGVLAGSGGSVSSGQDLETFTIHGWGWGLIQADLIPAFLLQFYSLAAHCYTRGTFVAPESRLLDSNAVNVPFATPAGATVPLMLKWLLVFEDPILNTIWIAKAIPRSWLAVDAGNITVTDTTTSFGRLSYTMSAASATLVKVQLSLSDRFVQHPPPGGIKLRLRLPGSKKIAAVTVGGKAWPSFDATEETVVFAKVPAVVADLQNIEVTVS
jgi:hypothetical protein